MRITTLTAIAPLLFVTATTLSAPAFATDTQQALTMCNARGSECNATHDKDGGYTIWVNDGANGNHAINCPPVGGGACGVIGAKGVGTGKGATVGTVLRPTLGAVPLKQGTDSSPKRTANPVQVNSQPVERSRAGAATPMAAAGNPSNQGCGSPYDPVKLDGKTFVPRQGNNSYIFPGVGLGAIASGSRLVTDDMFMAAAHRLAYLANDANIEQGSLYPAS
jgi:Malic enzyme, NAD binding domain